MSTVLSRESATARRRTGSGVRAFTLICVGQIISVIGSGLTGFALGVWVYQTSGSVTEFALVQLCFWVPIVLGAPLAGTLVDRWNRRTVMILCDSVAAAGTLVLALLLTRGRIEVWHVYVVTFVQSAMGILQRLARAAVTPLLVPRGQLGRANGLTQAIDAAGQLVSPVLAGVLVGVIQVPGVMAIDLATFGVAIAAVLAVHIPAPATTAEGRSQGSVTRDVLAGWRYLWDRRGLRALTLFFTAANFLGAFIFVLTTPLVLSFASPAVLGIISTAGGVGMLTGSLVLGMWGGPKRRIAGVLISALLEAVALVLVGLRPSPYLVGAAFFVGYLNVPICNSLANAILQSKVASDVQGRVFGVLQMMSSIAMPLSILISGPLVDRVFEPWMAENGPLAGSVGAIIGAGPGRGIALCFVLLGLFLGLDVLMAYLSPHLRRVEDDLPDAVLSPGGAAAAEA